MTVTIICTLLGTFIGIVGAVLSIIGAINYYKKTVQQDTTCNTRMETTLAYIQQGVDDIRLDIKAQANKISDMDTRLTRVEESTKSAHHRLDEFEK